IPGAGGTQRMPRLIGVEKTLDLILAARPVDVATGIALGFIDAEISGDVRSGTIEFARALVRDGAGPRPTGERSVDPKTATPAIIERLTQQAKSQYPNRQAALTAIKAVSASATLPFEQGLLYEEELANGAKATIESKALIHVFFAERDTRKVPGLPAEAKARPIASGGVVGAGTMGGGIAICFANSNLPGTLLATNTSTLDVTEIAAATRRPQDVIGLHFFSPANVMPLLEVVRTDSTDPAVIRTALDLAKALRKTPVVARVCYGFIGNRMMEGYAREAQRMVLEGATPRQVDDALEAWGMAMGILAVFDMAGIDVGVNVHRANADRYPPDPSYYQADFALHAAGRLGQ